MSRWRPSPDEERWLEVASELGAAVPRAAVAERTGGWRSPACSPGSRCSYWDSSRPRCCSV